MQRIKKTIQKVINNFGYEITKYNKHYYNSIPKDLDEDFISLFRSNKYIGSFTEKLYTTYKVTEYIVKNDIKGDFVECGVLGGRQIIIMALTLMKLNDRSRKIYLYDTFKGMTEPGNLDFKKARNLSAEDNHKKWSTLQKNGHNTYCYSPIEKVKKHVFSTGYPKENLFFIKGDIRETVPNNLHKKISFLRLDTDWYELTKHELDNLYDFLCKNGVLIIDDYGSWYGARKAVDEFFKNKNFKPLLSRTQKSERMVIKYDGI